MQAQNLGPSLIALPPELQDGYLIHSLVLSRRLNVLLLPRQVLLVGQPAEGTAAAMSFVHGVPQESTVAGVTNARDKRLRRYLLNVAKLPIPPGITFSSRGDLSLKRFISRTGFPLVLTTAIGENPSRKTAEIWNRSDFNEAVAKMRVLSEEQFLPARSLGASAYGENILSFSEDEEGRRIASPGMRLLVERSVAGCYVRCLVCDGEVLAAVELDRSTLMSKADISGQVHQDVKAMVLRAAAVIPGLFAASVDVVVEDPTSALGRQSCFIVEISERPRLDTYMVASPQLGWTLADALLLRQAAKSGLKLSDAVEIIAARLRLEGVSEPQYLLPKLANHCNEFCLSGCIRITDSVEGIVGGHIQGPAREIALLLEALVSGVGFEQRVSAAEVWQVPSENHKGFTVCDDSLADHA